MSRPLSALVLVMSLLACGASPVSSPVANPPTTHGTTAPSSGAAPSPTSVPTGSPSTAAARFVLRTTTLPRERTETRLLSEVIVADDGSFHARVNASLDGTGPFREHGGTLSSDQLAKLSALYDAADTYVGGSTCDALPTVASEFRSERDKRRTSWTSPCGGELRPSFRALVTELTKLSRR